MSPQMDDLHPILREALIQGDMDSSTINTIEDWHDDAMTWKRLLDANGITDPVKQDAIVSLINIQAEVSGVLKSHYYSAMMLGVRLARRGLV